ncbi:hypothetical protein HBO00_14180 [Pseudomonas sp. WS 5407]|jgi:FMN phosphatase YigB (HAD superfamily)|nr:MULTISPECIES: hypothetical protein [Pseudomonas]MBK3445968.1 hypothetical protein [Pseudomonas lactis]NMX45350.1 hypothetical protein [Pseudomonas sp. WS 5407]
MEKPAVILFDLYGTLLSFDQRGLIRHLARALGLPASTVSRAVSGV